MEEEKNNPDTVIGYTASSEFIPEDIIIELRKKVLILLADKNPYVTKENRQLSTTYIANAIIEYGHVNTTRDDIKPEIWVYYGGIYVPQGRTFIFELCNKILGKAYTTFFANLVIGKVESKTYVNPDKFFDHNIVEEVPIENGILNIMTRELSDFTPDKVFFAKLPIVYDDSKKCPKIKQHFETVLKTPEVDVPAMFEVFGYTLYKENKFEKAFMFSGSGSNGKSKTFEIIKSFIGFENCSSQPLQKLDNEPYSAAYLQGKMANIGGDIPSTPLKESEMFKGLVGRDGVTTQRKHLTNLNFTNYAKLLFSANQLPRPYEDDAAFWRRWSTFQFPYEFKTQRDYDAIPESEREKFKVCDPDIVDKLTTPDELSGLLNEALDSLHRLLKNKEFSNHKSNKEIRKFWLGRSDSFVIFCEDSIVSDPVDGVIEKQKLMASYMDYCRTNKLKPQGDKPIKYVLTTKYGVSIEQRTVNTDYVYCWIGIRMKEEGKMKEEGIQNSLFNK